MKKTIKSLFAASVAGMFLFTAAISLAANGVWNGTVDTLWTNSANWSTSPYPSGADTATFNNVGNGQSIDLTGLTSITAIIFDSPSVAAYINGTGAANSQTLVLADSGIITLTDTAANSQVFNAGLQLGTTMAAGAYTITNANTAQTLTFNQVFGALSGGSAAAKTLVVNGAGNTTILGDLWKGGASSLTLTHNSSGTLNLAGSNTVLQLNMNGGTNSVVDIGSGYLSLDNLGMTVLSSSQGGTINGTGTIRLSTNTGVNYGDVRPAAGKTLVINPSIVSTGGFELNDAGTVVLNGINTWDLEVYFTAAGTISVSKIGNQGSTDSNLGKGTKIMQSVDNGRLLYTGIGETTDRILELSKNFTLDHSGTGTLTFSTPFNVLANAKTLTLQGSSEGVGVIPESIKPGTGTTSLTKNGSGTWALSGANGYGGATTVNGGTLIVTGANGAITNSSGYTITTGGTLLLDNTSDANNTNRLRDASTLTMNGGTLCMTNNGGAINYRENAGTLSINLGNSTIATTPAIAGQSNILTFTALAYVSGKINFTGTGLGESDQNRIFIGGVTNGLMGAWATVNGTSYAAYDTNLGVYAFTTGFSDIAAEGGLPESVIPDNGSLLARINLAGVSGPITLQGEWTNSIGQVLQNTITNTTIATFDGVTNKLLKAAGLSIAEGKAELKVGVNANEGTLSALTAGGTLVLENNSTGNSLIINAPIINNTSASALSKIGTGMVVLNGANTYSGTTYISEGILAFAGASLQTVSGTTTIGNGTLAFAGGAAQTVSAAISGAGKVVKTGNGTLNLNKANTFTGGLTINEGTVATAQTGGLGTGGVTNNSTLNLTYAGAITYTGLSTGLGGSGTNNVTLGTGSATAALNGDYSAFTGVWNVGIGAVAGAGKTQMNGLDNSAATINILSNATLYCSSAVTHYAKLALNGGNTGESIGQLRLESNATWAGPITLKSPITQANDAFFGANNTVGVISGVIDDLGAGYSVDKIGPGAFVFSGANTYSGPTWVRAGTLSVPAMGSISGGASPLGGQSSADAGKVRLGAGGTTTTLIYTGTGETSDRLIDLAGSTGGATLTQSGTGLLKITGGMMISTTGNKTLTLQGATAGKGEFSGIISNGVSSVISVKKDGTGTWTLSGENTYGGATTVSGGTLLVNGSTANSSAMTVANSCTLGGSGTINGTVTMVAGSAMAPGDANSIGTLTLANNSANALTLNGNTLRYDLSNSVDVCDKIAITGTPGGLVLNGANVVALAFPNGAAPVGDYTLMTFQSYTGGGSFVLAKSYPNASLILNAGSLVLHVEGGSTDDTGGLTWKGNISGIWDNNILNWTNGTASVAYTEGNAVTFDDTATENFLVSSVSPVAPASLLFDNSANVYMVSAAIIGEGPLSKIGTSTATLSGLSTYNPGSMTIAAGTLTLSGASLLNSGNYATNILNGGTLSYASSATQTLSGAISGAGALTQSGSGMLILAGTNTFTGNLTVNTGNLLLTGSNALATAVVNAGAVAGDAVLKMPPGGSLVGSGDMTIGSVNNGNGAFYLSGGQVVRTNVDAERNFAFGMATGGYGYFNMSDGELSSQRIALGIANNVGTALARITGGIATFNTWVLIGRSGGIGVMTIDGGSVIQTGTANSLMLCYESGRGELNMTGGLFDNAGKPLVVRNATASGSTGIVNVCSGTLIVNSFVNRSTAFLNFNGGLLKAGASSTTFLPSNMTGVYVNGPFGPHAGGAMIDSAGKDITFAAPLLAPTGSGVTAISLSSEGSGYIGEPYVSITGDGFGATAVANMADDGTGKGTYKVASVTVTTPGTNYTTATVSFLKGGAAAQAPTVQSVTRAPATPGGLTKLGLGTLTLSGTNTYAGATTISNGTVRLGIANALPTNNVVNVNGGIYDLGGFTVTNSAVNVTSGLIINGKFAASSLTVDDSAAIYATLTGTNGLSKNGNGILALSRNFSDFTTGPLVVNGGTLKLMSGPLSVGLSYWLDAADGSKITLSGSNVTYWADSSPSGVNFTNTVAAQWPVYVTNAINGLPAVRFNGTSQKMVATKVANAQTVFIVNNVKARASIDGIWGWHANDVGIRLTAESTWAPGNTGDFAFGGQTYINGVLGSAITYTTPHLLTAVSTTQRTWTTDIGQYYATSRWYNGDIGEVLVYSSILSTTDRQAVESYLMAKWMGGSNANLPTGGSVVLASGTLLDLDNQPQTFAGLSGSGTVSNGEITVTGSISPAGTNVIGTLTAKVNTTLSGKLLVDVNATTNDCLVVEGSLTLSPSATLEIADLQGLSTLKMYTLITSTEPISRSFASTNITDTRWALRKTVDNKVVQLYFKGGTLIRLM